MAVEKTIDVSQPFEIDGWQVIPASLMLTKKQDSHQLPAKVFQVLLLLVEKHGSTVSHHDFYQAIWHGNENVAKRGLTNAIWQLRKIFDNPENADEQSIKTVAKTGYELLLPTKQQLEDDVSKLKPWSNPVYLAIAFACIFVFAATSMLWPSSDEVKYGAPKNLTYFQGVEEYPSVSSDGKWLAFSWEEEDGHGQLFVKSLQDNDETLQQITFDESVHGSPTWSRNNMELAFTRINEKNACEVVRKNLLSGEEAILTACYYERFHRGLDWANSGDYLVVSQLTSDNIPALFRYNLAEQKLSQITHPKVNERDTQISIHPNSERIAFIRSQDTRSDVYVVDQNGERQVSQIAVPIYGLTWTPDGESILINALYQGESSIWRLNPVSGDLALALKDSTPFNLTINPITQAVIYSKHKPVENIVKFIDGHRHVEVSSAGRDLYPSVHNDFMAFISSRSGHFDIWLKDMVSGKSAPITNNEGVVGLPVVMDQEIAFVLKESENQASDIYIYNINTKQRINLTKDKANYKHLTWSSKNKTLLVSSDRSGSWELWQYSFAENQFNKLTENGGSYGYQLESTLYFARENQNGIWRLHGDKLDILIPELGSEDWGNWVLTENGIYYVNRDEQQAGVYFKNFTTGQDTLLYPFDKNEIKRNRSLAIGDNAFYITLVGAHQADIIHATIPEN